MPYNANIKGLILMGLLVCSACKFQSDKAKNALSDSLARKHHMDSLLNANPYLIIPKDSNYTGDYVKSYPNGVKQFKGFFRFGKRHGQWLSFYANGHLWSEMEYDKGLRHGKNAAYYENGNIRQSGFYKHDRRHSVWMFYDTSGKMVLQQICKNDTCKLVEPKTSVKSGRKPKAP